jgi:hypothetical protein
MKLFLSNSDYQSDLDRLLADLKQADPGIVEGQKTGMSLLWDKEPLDVEARRRDNRSRVKRPAYPYR